MLPQFGFTEFLLIAIVALVVVGPKDLPMMMRKLGQFVGKARAMATEFRAAFDDIARQAELDELRKEIEDLKNNNAVKEATDEMRSFERDVNEKVMRETPDIPADTAPDAPEPASPAPTDADGSKP